MIVQQQNSKICLSGKRELLKGKDCLCYTTQFDDNHVNLVSIEDVC